METVRQREPRERLHRHRRSIVVGRFCHNGLLQSAATERRIALVSQGHETGQSLRKDHRYGRTGYAHQFIQGPIGMKQMQQHSFIASCF